jgi:hypothetical protein
MCDFSGHCPSADDPYTISYDETNCAGVAADVSGQLGSLGNLCHVECANHGLCNYETGECSCFPDWSGVACNTLNGGMTF